MKRKIIQIAVAAFRETQLTPQEKFIYALCNDGTVWENVAYKWYKIEDIPQDDHNGDLSDG